MWVVGAAVVRYTDTVVCVSDSAGNERIHFQPAGERSSARGVYARDLLSVVIRLLALAAVVAVGA